jgi:hypothetical protein
MRPACLRKPGSQTPATVLKLLLFKRLQVSNTLMNRVRQLSLIALALAAGASALPEPLPAPAAMDPGYPTEVISTIAARLIADAIPREYERSKDWGRTKRITTGLRSSGNFFDFDIHRRKTEVNHGVWKKYRITLIEPEKNLDVKITNLRSIGANRFALTLSVTAKLHGWARAKVYDRGIHIIALEGVADTTVRLSLDAEIALETVPTQMYVPGIAVRPVVTDARLKLDDFRLKRISDLRGSLAHELGDGLRHLIEDELAGPKLVAKLNRSIEKRRERLMLTPDKLLGQRSRSAAN